MLDPNVMPALMREEDFVNWRRCDEPGFEQSRKLLEQHDGPLADKLLVVSVGNQNRTVLLGNPAFARSAAIEDIDSRVSQGYFMATDHGVGTETGRKLKVYKLEETNWQGSVEFHALYRGRIRAFCIQEIHSLIPRERKPRVSIDDERFNEGTLAIGPHEPLQFYDLAISELSRFGEILLQRKREAEAGTAGGIVGVLKKAKQRSQGGDVEESWFEKPGLFWKAVAVELGIKKEDALAKRKQRFFEQICALRADVSEWLFARAIRMLVDDAMHDIRICETMLNVRSVPCPNVIEALRDFLLWHLAVQHPEFRGKTLEEIRGKWSGALIIIRSAPRAYQWPPSGEGFTAFCASHDLLGARPKEDLICLRDGLLTFNMTPHPAAMISIVRSLLGTGGQAAMEAT